MIKRVYVYYAKRVGGDEFQCGGAITRTSWLPNARSAYEDVKIEMQSFGEDMVIRYFARIQ